MSNRKSYPRNQSPLFKVTSPAKLASILSLPLKELNWLTELKNSKNNYKRWKDKKSGRLIQEPKKQLARAHQRMGNLLSRIETPDFLYSAVKGRSYILNAAQHDPNEPTVKIDICKFYPSARVQEVYHFFLNRMQCPGDVAGLLARLLTVDGHLPTGSSVSPILSYFAYENMFCEIYKLAVSRRCKMTCYVDDMVFTGSGATHKLYYDLRPIVQRYHLKIHKIRTFKAGQSKVITGVEITRRGMMLPRKQIRKIEEGEKLFNLAATDEEKIDISKTLTGQIYAAAQIDRRWYLKAVQKNKVLQNLRRKNLQ